MSKAATRAGPPKGTKPLKLDGMMGVNTPEDEILSNIERNIRRQLPQLNVYPPQNTPICIVGGGWSLNDTFEELRELVWQGVPVMALNGAGNWLVERNIRPNILMVLDAREYNTKFVENEFPRCKYFLASQCHPKMFDLCEGREVYIYHVCSTVDEKPFKDMLDKFYRGRWHSVPGGSTVGLRSFLVARMLGFEFQHLFGFDSCYSPSMEHHAYEQDWQKDEEHFRMWCAGREFHCSAWQASQAHNFLGQIKGLGNNFHLDVHGDGLLAHLLKTGAKLKTLETITPPNEA